MGHNLSPTRFSSYLSARPQTARSETASVKLTFNLVLDANELFILDKDYDIVE